MPNRCLKYYFDGRNLFEEIDFKKMKEGAPDQLFDAWLQLSPDERSSMEAEFSDIFTLSCQKGIKAIIDQAEQHMRQQHESLSLFTEKLSALRNHYERAMITFLEFNDIWKTAMYFYHADTLSTYWRKRKDLPNIPASVDEGSVRYLAESMNDFFYRKHGRGKNCMVETFRRGELDYFFCYPEDYSQQAIE
jgi:hypothetical protein